MNSNALYSAIQQALRSTALTFFPATFITLVIWATSGSISGNTADPLRSAVWLWLGAHLIGFKVKLANDAIGLFTYLPILTAIFPILALRSGIRRIKLFTNESSRAIIYFIFFYLLIGLTFALISQTNWLKPIWWQIPLNLVVCALFAILFSPQYIRRPKNSFPNLFAPFLQLTIFWLGVGLIIESFAIYTHRTTVENLTTVVSPGIVGGITLWLIQILYLPNLLINLFSYLLGFGYSIGAGSKIAPTVFHIGDIPAFPLLGTLPTGKHPAIYWITGFMGFTYLLLTITLLIKHRGHKSAFAKIGVGVGGLCLGILIASYLDRGAVITVAESGFGVNWWEPATFTALFFLAEVLISILIFRIYQRFRARKVIPSEAA